MKIFFTILVLLTLFCLTVTYSENDKGLSFYFKNIKTSDTIDENIDVLYERIKNWSELLGCIKTKIDKEKGIFKTTTGNNNIKFVLKSLSLDSTSVELFHEKDLFDNYSKSRTKNGMLEYSFFNFIRMFQYDSLKTDLPVNEAVYNNLFGSDWYCFYSWYTDSPIQELLFNFRPNKTLELKYYNKEKRDTSKFSGSWELDNANIITIKFESNGNRTEYKCLTDSKMLIGITKNKATTGMFLGAKLK